MPEKKNWLEFALDAVAQAGMLVIAAILAKICAESAWELYGADIKAFVSKQWSAFCKWQTEFTFVQWCQRVVVGLGKMGVGWAKGDSIVFTKVNRDTQSAQTFFRVDEDNTFASEEYVLLDGNSTDSFIRATGKVVEVDDLMNQYFVHEGVV